MFVFGRTIRQQANGRGKKAIFRTNQSSTGASLKLLIFISDAWTGESARKNASKESEINARSNQFACQSCAPVRVSISKTPRKEHKKIRTHNCGSLYLLLFSKQYLIHPFQIKTIIYLVVIYLVLEASRRSSRGVLIFIFEERNLATMWWVSLGTKIAREIMVPLEQKKSFPAVTRHSY